MEQMILHNVRTKCGMYLHQTSHVTQHKGETYFAPTKNNINNISQYDVRAKNFSLLQKNVPRGTNDTTQRKDKMRYVSTPNITRNTT